MKLNILTTPRPRRAGRRISPRGSCKMAGATARRTAPVPPVVRHSVYPVPPAPAAVVVVDHDARPDSSAPTERDAFHLYVRELGQSPLLTPAEEIALARRVQRGDKDAREQMIKANLRLVVKIARDYEGMGVPLLDLISEGNIGLMKGVERFDPNKGAKLSTYASWWIKQAIRRALSNQSRTVRLPVHVTEYLAHIRKAETKLREILQRDVSDEEIAAELGFDVRRVQRYRHASTSTTSLDAPLGDESDANRWADVVPDDRAVDPFEQLRHDTDATLIREVVESLEPRERKIVEQRFGLIGDRRLTLEEIGEGLGLTRERIRQIQEKALTKLRRRIDQKEAGRSF